MLPRLAWSLCGLTVALVALDVLVSVQAVSLTSETAVAVHGFPFVDGACVGSALMGALIVSRFERHPVGWLLSAIGVLTSISLLTEAYAYWVLESDGPGPRALGGTAAWVAQLCGGQLVIALLSLMFLLAPDGRFLSRRWRRAAVVPVVGAGLCLAAVLSVDPTGFDLLDADESLGPERRLVLSLGFLLINLGLLLALVSMLRRLWASSGEERQQVRLIALSAVLAVIGLVILVVAQEANGGQQTWLSGVPLFVSFFLMPILFAVAVLRYRLYDLDVIINRTVVVVAGAAFAAVGYTAIVVVSGQLLESRAGGFWLSLLATVLVALAFQPIRRVVVRWANRAAYGDRAEPYEALADFSRRLAAAPDPDELLPAVAEAATRAVSAAAAQATLGIPGGPAVSGTWGPWPTDPDQQPHHRVPVRTEGRELGWITVALPRGRTLRRTDRRLLEALADQTATAFRNTSLAGALADRVAAVTRTTRQLAESRRRLIAADDAARRMLEATITRDVLPSLQALPAGIRRARAALDRGTTPEIDPLVDDTNEALDALRELTRGVFPAQLARSGLAAALRSLAARAVAPTDLTVTEIGRLSPRVEAAVYFCCAEALGAAAGPTTIELARVGSGVVLRVGGELRGLDLPGLGDRVEAVGGRVEVRDGLLVVSVPGVGEPAESPAGPRAPGGAVPHG